jgi:trehalose 6-phosphate phosphatase
MPMAPDKLDPNAVALFLDVDGTLLEIMNNPADVSADNSLVNLLEACIESLGGAMALISGRSVDEVDRIFAPAVFPVAGSHGAELRIDGGKIVTVAHDPLPEEALAPLAELAAAHDGLLLEHKRGGVSLHYRRAPELESGCRELVTRIMAEIGDSFRLIAGKMVFEIAPGAYDKGAAIRTFLENSPFSGRVPVFLGDDVTDEDGFRVVNELAGLSIRIGDIERSAACYRLDDVAAVRPWLYRALLENPQQQHHGETRS